MGLGRRTAGIALATILAASSTSVRAQHAYSVADFGRAERTRERPARAEAFRPNFSETIPVQFIFEETIPQAVRDSVRFGFVNIYDAHPSFQFTFQPDSSVHHISHSYADAVRQGKRYARGRSAVTVLVAEQPFEEVIDPCDLVTMRCYSASLSQVRYVAGAMPTENVMLLSLPPRRSRSNRETTNASEQREIPVDCYARAIGSHEFGHVPANHTWGVGIMQGDTLPSDVHALCESLQFLVYPPAVMAEFLRRQEHFYTFERVHLRSERYDARQKEAFDWLDRGNAFYLHGVSSVRQDSLAVAAAYYDDALIAFRAGLEHARSPVLRNELALSVQYMQQLLVRDDLPYSAIRSFPQRAPSFELAGIPLTPLDIPAKRINTVQF
jgi:hypothetical protein